MSAPPDQTMATHRTTPPRPATVVGAIYKLLLRNVATRGRLAAVGALSALYVLVAFIVHLQGDGDTFKQALDLVNGGATTLVPVGALVFGAATLGDLIDDGSAVYLWLRPVHPRLIVAAAWAATVTITAPLVGVPVLLGAAIIDGDSKLLGASTSALAVGVLAYSALAVTAGIRFRRALPWGLAYILLWEGFVASAGKTASKLAMRSYLRSILSDITEVPLKLATMSLFPAVVVPLVVTVAALAYAAHRLGNTDVA